MKIAFIHYHLKPGGVTTVIRQQIEAIQDDCEPIVLTGEKPEQFQIPVIHIPGIAYDRNNINSSSPEKTAEDIIRAIHHVWPDGCDIVHIHNPILAKNRNFLNVLKILHRKGFRLLLQIHDFAEDGRPFSYYPENYPENCHYCVINSRDHGILKNAGLRDQGLHLLPNMVNPIDRNSPECRLQNFVLYPVRAIRRKNIGEAILLSLFFQNNETLAVTLPPNSPMDMASYHGWKEYVALHQLPMMFEASARHDFSSLVCAAEFIMTTSISEGFGFSFLEPWTADQILWGRNLPEICMDFQQKGIRLENLYNRIKIPIDWLSREALFQAFQSTMEQSLKLFGYPVDTFDPVDGFQEFIQNDNLDFGMLSELFQKQVISHILASPENKRNLIAGNPFLSEINVSDQQSIVAHNKRVTLLSYNQSMYQKTLFRIYESVKNLPIVHAIDKEKLLFQFLTPARLNLLKWSVYEESRESSF
ncbi:MAG: hypothetical protein C4522_09455 [Desulfobacteraceae bacterium]|nr:MAG: hypothetical protein C4522_09455 [Desulfobacteraceae bacterium]